MYLSRSSKTSEYLTGGEVEWRKVLHLLWYYRATLSLPGRTYCGIIEQRSAFLAAFSNATASLVPRPGRFLACMGTIGSHRRPAIYNIVLIAIFKYSFQAILYILHS